MPIRLTVFLHPTCDKCGRTTIFEGTSREQLLKLARSEGWFIMQKIICPQCCGKE